MGKEFLPVRNKFQRGVSATTSHGGTNFSKCPRECNLNPIQVRYLAALHPDAVFSHILVQIPERNNCQPLTKVPHTKVPPSALFNKKVGRPPEGF